MDLLINDGPERQRARHMKATFEASAPADDDVVYRMRLAAERQRRASNVLSSSAARSALAGLGLALGGVVLALATGHLDFGSGAGLGQVSIAPVNDELSIRNPRVSDTRRPLQSKGPAQKQVEATAEVKTTDSPSTRLAHRVARLPINESAKRPEPQTLSAEQVKTGWSEVAGALRDGKDVQAAEAIERLAQSDDPETRDSALLVRLRLKLGSQEGDGTRATEEQRAEAARLASQGATPSIRASARRLLERMTELENSSTNTAQPDPSGN